jgi:phosphate transport system protein
MRQLDVETNDLRNSLADMSSLVKEMINFVIDHLLLKSDKSIEDIYSLEREVNIREIEIDEKCLKLIALYQPVGMDLRFITSVMKINSDLERMGDEVINIGQALLKLFEYPELKSLSELPNLPKMTEIVRKMVEDSIFAFNTSDVTLARAVLNQDDEVDDLQDDILKNLGEYIKKSSVEVSTAIAISLISVVKNIERLGDHATNISEDVIFMVQGKDIRHPRSVNKIKQ